MQEQEEESQERPPSRQEVRAPVSLQVQVQVLLLNSWSALHPSSRWRHPQEQEISSSTSTVAHSLEHFPPPRGHLAMSTGTSLLEVAVATQAVLVLWQPPLHLCTVTWVGVSWSMVVLVGHGTITTLSLGLQAEVDLREEEMWVDEHVTGVSGEGASMDSEQEGPEVAPTRAARAAHTTPWLHRNIFLPLVHREYPKCPKP